MAEDASAIFLPFLRRCSKRATASGKGFDLRYVPLFKKLRTMLLKPLAKIGDLLIGQEHADDLIAAFANLASHIVEFDGNTIVSEGLNPSARMQVDGIDQRAVYIKYDSFNHRTKFDNGPTL